MDKLKSINKIKDCSIWIIGITLIGVIFLIILLPINLTVGKTDKAYFDASITLLIIIELACLISIFIAQILIVIEVSNLPNKQKNKNGYYIISVSSLINPLMVLLFAIILIIIANKDIKQLSYEINQDNNKENVDIIDNPNK